MNKIMDIFFAPTKIFTSLKEKPEWLTPFLIVLIVVTLGAVLTVSMTKETIIAKQEEAMRDRGMTEEQIERAQNLASGPFLIITSAIGAAVFIAITLLLFTLVLNLFIPLFGGNSAFKTVFSVVCFSSLITIPGVLLKLILIGVTRSPYVTTSLALFAPNLAKTSFGYLFLAGFDFFIIWEMILVALGISITNEVKRQNAYILVFLVWLVSVFIGTGFGALRGPGA